MGSLLVGAAVGAGVSAIGSYISAKTQQSYAEDVNQQAMSFSEEMMKKQNQFNKSMYEQQLKDSRETYEKYQSPKALVSGIKDIGINPAAVLGSLGAGGSPSVPSAPQSASSGIPSLINPGIGFGNMISDVSQSVGTLVDAAQKDARLKPEIENLLADTHGKQLLNDYQNLININYEKYGDKKAAAELNSMVADAFLKNMSGKYQEAATEVEKVTKKLLSNDLAMSDEKRVQYGSYLIAMMRNMNLQNDLLEEQKGLPTAQKKQLKSQTSLNYSTSAYYKALTATENGLRDGRIKMQTLNNQLLEIQRGLMSNERLISDQTVGYKASAIIAECEAAQLLPARALEEFKIVEANARRAAVQADWEKLNQYRDYCVSFLQCITSAVGAGGQYYGAAVGRLSAQERNGIYSRFVDEYQQRGLHDRFPSDFEQLNQPQIPLDNPRSSNGFGFVPYWQR